jgi:dihydrodipicolinate synthase/N-acetylneuraminate lyase
MAALSREVLRDVFAVPPLARRRDARRALDIEESDRIRRHITAGGITRLIYGGNAFLYHLTLAEYEELLGWLAGLAGEFTVIPSAGPSFGRAMDQAPVLRRHGFPAVMMLPCGDPRDAAGLERGYREFSDAAETPLVVYLKDETNFGVDKEAGLDSVARLVESGVCTAIKYAVVRADPSSDPYLEALLQRVDRSLVLSGMGERPAVCHLREWRLPGFTTGSGCIAPRLSHALFEACARGDFGAAEKVRASFLPLEDLRDAWGPARVLHHTTELAGIAITGPTPPYVSPLADEQLERLRPIAAALRDRDTQS